MHDFQEQCQVHGQQCQVSRQRSKNGFSIRFILFGRRQFSSMILSLEMYLTFLHLIVF